MSDVTIVGGGIIGLSIAHEAARDGMRVRVLEAAGFGREASWAGAGILPPGNLARATSPESRLRGLSAGLWPNWAEDLAAKTGVEFGYRRSGAIQLFDDQANRDARLQVWRDEGIPAEPLRALDINRLEPQLIAGQGGGIYLPTQFQIRNPRYVKALIAACTGQGVELIENAGHACWSDPARPGHGLIAGGRRFQSDVYCIAGGAWSGELLRPLGFDQPIEPVRGQIVLLHDWRLPVSRIIESGLRYLVPRGDGRILVGSTMEHAGYAKQVTAEGVAGLLDFASRICPPLAAARIERTWAGLRPGSPDGLPFLGFVPGFDNVCVAAGHMRSGIQNSPGTARLIAQLIRREPTDIELEPFAADRPISRAIEPAES